MRFVRREQFASVYRRPDGMLVQVPHGWTTRHEYDDNTVTELWSLWTRFVGGAFEDFREYLRERLTDPDDADQLAQCVDCDSPGDYDDFYTLANCDRVCDDCRCNYWCCDQCDVLYESTNTTLAETEVCDGCIQNHWTWCEDCDGYYRDEDAGEHGHNDDDEDGCDCESPAQRFSIRNDGEPALDNDTRATITLPAGTISAEGIGTIARYLRDRADATEDQDDRQKLWSLSYQLDQLGERWQTKDGNYTKRLSRFAYKNHALKLAPEIVSQVGCIARDHSTAVDFAVEVTRDLNLPAEDFAHEDSCWWQSYSSSRCALKSNGGFGLRTFGSYGVSGRAWVMPMRETEDGDLVPTFETQEPAAFVVFNGYGDLNGYAPARIMAHMAGMTYRKISFTCAPMYVNNNAGYLVAPEEIASRYDDGALYLETDYHANLHETERILTHA